MISNVTFTYKSVSQTKGIFIVIYIAPFWSVIIGHCLQQSSVHIQKNYVQGATQTVGHQQHWLIKKLAKLVTANACGQTYSTISKQFYSLWAVPLYEDKRQHLLNRKESLYCLLALHGSVTWYCSSIVPNYMYNHYYRRKYIPKQTCSFEFFWIKIEH